MWGRMCPITRLSQVTANATPPPPSSAPYHPQASTGATTLDFYSIMAPAMFPYVGKIKGAYCWEISLKSKLETFEYAFSFWNWTHIPHIGTLIRDGHADAANADNARICANIREYMRICASEKYGAWPSLITRPRTFWENNETFHLSGVLRGEQKKRGSVDTSSQNSWETEVSISKKT